MRKLYPVVAALIVSVLCAVGTQGVYGAQTDPVMKKLEKFLQREKEIARYRSLPKVSLNAVNQPLGVVMQNFAVLTGYSLTFADGVDLNTPVTIRLVNTPITDALKEILDPIGYTFSIDTDFKRITVKAFVTKIVRIPPDVIDDENVDYTFSSTGEAGKSGGGGSTSGGKTEATGSISVNDRVKGKDIVKSLVAHVKAILSNRGTVSLDPVTGSLYIRDYKPYVDDAMRFVKEWINEFSKEVYVKAYVLDISLDKDHQLGIDWSNVQNDIIRSVNTLKWEQTTTTLMSQPTGVLTFLENSKDPFQLMIKALETQGKVRVLSEPRLIIMNHEVGYIQSGDSIPYISQIQENYIGSQGNNAQTTYQISRVLEGVTLAIKPHIMGNKIDLTIIPTLSSIRDWRKFAIGDSQVENPVITSRNAYTKLTVKDGEFLVIGGSRMDLDKKTVVKVPILGDIPILGGLFRTTLKKKTRNVMLVLLQVKIVDEKTRRNLHEEAVSYTE